MWSWPTECSVYIDTPIIVDCGKNVDSTIPQSKIKNYYKYNQDQWYDKDFLTSEFQESNSYIITQAQVICLKYMHEHKGSEILGIKEQYRQNYD